MVLISPDGSPAKLAEAEKLGAAGYVRKPFTPAQIRAAVERSGACSIQFEVELAAG